MNRNSRTFLVIFGRPFLRRLVLPFGLLLLGVSQADATVDWSASREALQTRDPWQTTLALTMPFLLWCAVAGRGLRAVWRQPVIAFLVRQPLGRWQWVRCLAPSLLIAFLPVAGLCWLAPRYANPLVHYAGFVGLAWPVILGASYRGRAAAVWVGTGTACLMVTTLAYAWQPAAAAYAALAFATLLIPLSVSGIRDQIVGTGGVDSRHLASSSPVRAIFRRDLLYLRRTQRKALAGLAASSTLAALAMLALRVNGDVTGREAFEYACGLLAFVLLPAYALLERLKSGLGRELVRRHWPIGNPERAVALLYLMLLLIGPGFIALAALGSTMGPTGLMLFPLHAATSLVTLAALFALSLAQEQSLHGWSMLMLLLHAVVAVALPAWLYALVAAVALPIGGTLVVFGLRGFTRTMEAQS